MLWHPRYYRSSRFENGSRILYIFLLLFLFFFLWLLSLHHPCTARLLVFPMPIFPMRSFLAVVDLEL